MHEEAKYERLLSAVEKGDLALVKELVEEKGLNPALIKNSKGFSAAIIAASRGHLSIVRYLAEFNKANIETRTTVNDSTVLMFAAEYNRIDVVRYLVEEQHVNVDDVNNKGLTALIFATASKSIATAAYLYKHSKYPKRISWLIFSLWSRDDDILSLVNILLVKEAIPPELLVSVLPAEEHPHKGTTALCCVFKKYSDSVGGIKESYKTIALTLLQQLVNHHHDLEAVIQQGSSKGLAWLIFALWSGDNDILSLVSHLLTKKIIPPKMLASAIITKEHLNSATTALCWAVKYYSISSQSARKNDLSLSLANSLSAKNPLPPKMLASVITAEKHPDKGTTALYCAFQYYYMSSVGAVKETYKTIALTLLQQLVNHYHDLKGVIQQGSSKGLSWLILALWSGDNDILSLVDSVLAAEAIPPEVLASVITDERHPDKGTTALFSAFKYYYMSSAGAVKETYKKIALTLLQQLVNHHRDLKGVIQQGPDKGVSWLILALWSGDNDILSLVDSVLAAEAIPPEVLASVITGEEHPDKGTTALFSAFKYYYMSSAGAVKETYKKIALTLLQQLVNHHRDLKGAIQQGPAKGLSWLTFAKRSQDLDIQEMVRKLHADEKIQLDKLPSLIPSTQQSRLILKDLIIAGEKSKILDEIRNKSAKKLDRAILDVITVEQEDSPLKGMDLLMIILSELIEDTDQIKNDYTFYQQYAIKLIHRKCNFEFICESDENRGDTIPRLALATKDKEIMDAIFAAVREKRIKGPILMRPNKIDARVVNNTVTITNILYQYLEASYNSDLANLYKLFVLYFIVRSDKIDECLPSGLTVAQLGVATFDPDIICEIFIAYKAGKMGENMLDSTIQTDMEINSHQSSVQLLKGENLIMTLLRYLYRFESRFCHEYPERRFLDEEMVEKFVIDIIHAKKNLDGPAVKLPYFNYRTNWLSFVIHFDRPNLVKEVNKLIQQGRVPAAVLNYKEECAHCEDEARYTVDIFFLINHVIDNYHFHEETINSLRQLEITIRKKMSEKQPLEIEAEEKTSEANINHEYQDELIERRNRIKVEKLKQYHLNLDFKEITSEKIQDIRHITKGKKQLTALSIKHFDSSEHLEKMSDAFENTTQAVATFNLSNCQISLNFYTRIMHKIICNDTIRLVSITDCTFEKKTLYKILGSIGKSSSTIEILDLSGCNLSNNRDCSQVARIIRENQYLKRINLTDCLIGADRMKLLLEAFEKRCKSRKKDQKLTIDVEGNDFNLEDWQMSLEERLAKEYQPSENIVNKMVAHNTGSDPSEEKTTTMTMPQVSAIHEFPQCYSQSPKQNRPPRTGPKIHREVPMQSEKRELISSKKARKRKQKIKSSKNAPLIQPQHHQTNNDFSENQGRHKQGWHPSDEPPGGHVNFDPKFKVVHPATDHLPQRVHEQKREDHAGNFQIRFLRRNGLFAQRTLDNVEQIKSFEKDLIQPLEGILDVKAENENMKMIKKYALCMDIASIGEAAIKDQYAGSFEEEMCQILRQVRHVFFKSFLEIERFKLEEIEVVAKSLIKLSSDKKLVRKDTINDIWHKILQIDIETDKSDQEKVKIIKACEDIKNQLIGEDDGNILYDRAFQYLEACIDKAKPFSDENEHKLAAGLRHELGL